MGLWRTSSALSVMVVLSGLSRAAAGGEPTTPECLAAYEESVNLTKNHQMRATLAKLALCSSAACPAQIRNECLARVSETDASIPTVVFDVKDAAGALLFEVKVKMDGELLADRLSGSALSVDPGAHVFTFESAGHTTLEKRLLILEGEKRRRERVELEAIVTAKPVTAPPVAVAKSEALNPAPPPPAKKPLGTARTLALVLGGAGVAATGLGVAFGVIARSRRDEAMKVCWTPTCPTPDGSDKWNDAASAATIATGAFVIGAAGIASGVILWLRGEPAPDSASGPQVSLGPGGLRVWGSW